MLNEQVRAFSIDEKNDDLRIFFYHLQGGMELSIWS